MSPFGTKKNFGISDSLLDAVRGVVKGEELEEKKLDPVGQEDDDVDNDGDTDSTDKYLKKRRKAIGKAMKGKKDDVDTDPKLDEAKEDTATLVAKALKKMGVKPNAKEDEVIKKIPDVLKKMGMQQVLNMMNRSKDYRNDMLGDVLDSLSGMKEGLEDNTSNPANSQHLCAKQVVHEEWGTGNPINGMHAEPDADGQIAWYDVMFDHGIEREVSINEMKVTKSEAHMNHKKKK